MADPIAELLGILELERLEHNLFRGQSPQTGWQRVFGGQVIAQALVASCRTVEERLPHSLHGYFLLPGDPKVPIIYEVDRIRDGRSFTTRRVVAIQHGRAIFSMSSSFHLDEDGFDHAMAMPDVPSPEALPDDVEVRAGAIPAMPAPIRAYYETARPIELRLTDPSRYAGAKSPESRFSLWTRATGRLPDDPVLHRAVLAYMSDLTLLDTALMPHGRSLFERGIQAASLDHALWFHRPFRADEWLLFVQDAPSASGARGFSRGSVYDRSGGLVASVAQEGLIRVNAQARPSSDPG